MYDRIGRIDLEDREWYLMNLGFATLEDATTPATLDLPASGDRFGLQMYQRVKGNLALAGRRVLEVGCGRGAAFLASRYAPACYLAIDFAPKLVDFCRRSHSAPNLDFKVGNAMHMELSDAQFDHVFNVESSHCYNDKHAFWREVCRVLKPGGYFHYADDFRPRTWDRTVRQLEHLGFAILEQENITPGVLLAMDQDAERRRMFVRQSTPLWLKHETANWVGLPGSQPYNRFKSGRNCYMRCIARRER